MRRPWITTIWGIRKIYRVETMTTGGTAYYTTTLCRYSLKNEPDPETPILEQRSATWEEAESDHKMAVTFAREICGPSCLMTGGDVETGNSR